jgi:hypothetical protein
MSMQPLCVQRRTEPAGPGGILGARCKAGIQSRMPPGAPAAEPVRTLTRWPAPAVVPAGSCPRCGTSHLAEGQERCQGCGALDKIYGREC